MQWTLKQILALTEGELIHGDPEQHVGRFSTDTRTLQAGEWFVPLRGERFDGHDFLAEAAAAGALGVFARRDRVDSDRRILRDFPAVIAVNDPLEALVALAQNARDAFSGPVIGITGSNGKTTTKEWTAAILGPKTLRAPASYNNRIGVAKTLVQLDPNRHAAVVCELGTNHPGEIAALIRIVRPTVGVLLNVGPTHLEFFGSLEAVAQEKSALPRAAEWAVLNADDPLVSRLGSECRQKVTFGTTPEADVQARNVVLDDRGRPQFELWVGGRCWGPVTVPALGEHQVENALAAAAVGAILKVEPSAVRERLSNAPSPPMRLEPRDLGGVLWINDAYNANPVSVQAAFRVFQRLPVSGRRWVVLGEMAELGAAAESLHAEVAAALSPKWCDVFVAVGSYSDTMARAAQRAGVTTIFRFLDPREAAEVLRELLRPGDAVLLKGSRAARMERIQESYAQHVAETLIPDG